MIVDLWVSDPKASFLLWKTNLLPTHKGPPIPVLVTSPEEDYLKVSDIFYHPFWIRKDEENLEGNKLKENLEKS